MKKLVCLLILFSLIYTPVYGAPARATRGAVGTAVAKAFMLESKSYRPLLSYNDWNYVRTEDRPFVSAAISSRLFVPDGASFMPDKMIDNQDIQILSQGITRYIKQFPGTKYYQGQIEEKRDGYAVIASGPNRFTASIDRPVISESLKTLEEIDIGQVFSFIADEKGTFYMGHTPIENDKTDYHVYKARLYLYNPMDNSLIVTYAHEFQDELWVPVSMEKYEVFSLSPSTVFMYREKKLTRDFLNYEALDNKIYLVTNDKGDVLFVKITESIN